MKINQNTLLIASTNFSGFVAYFVWRNLGVYCLIFTKIGTFVGDFAKFVPNLVPAINSVPKVNPLISHKKVLLCILTLACS